jgi:hypothetical protein
MVDRRVAQHDDRVAKPHLRMADPAIGGDLTDPAFRAAERVFHCLNIGVTEPMPKP